MPNKCVATNCRSEHHNDQPHSQITFHRFPLNDEELLGQWLQNLSQENYLPNRHSRLCSLHFDESDFAMESVDSNITRKRKRGDDLRKQRFLKPDAVPTVFSNHVHRSGKALSVSRIKNENKHYVNLAEQMFAEDSVCNIDELCARLELEKDKPTGYIILKVPDILIIALVR